MDFGTGCLKVTPAHDPNDYMLGREAQSRKHRHLQRRRHSQPRRRASTSASTASRCAAASSTTSPPPACIEKVEDYDEQGRLQRAQRRHRSRAAPVVAVVHEDERDGSARPRSCRRRHDKVRSREIQEHLPPLDGGCPRLVYLAPALVGPPHSGLVSARRQRRRGRDGRRGSRRGPQKGSGADAARRPASRIADVLDTWFSSWLWPIALFNGILDPDNKEISYYYPTDYAGHRPRHHLLLGFENDHGRI